ncbi:hypothetical protein NE541_14870, partial [Coprococcus eutactus]
GTLHDENTSPVKQIEMPKPRPRSLLTMEDMGMNHDMSSMKGMNQDMPMNSATVKAASDKNDNTVVGWANASTPEGNKALQYSDL